MGKNGKLRAFAPVYIYARTRNKAVYKRRATAFTAMNLDFDNQQGSSHPKSLASLVSLVSNPPYTVPPYGEQLRHLYEKASFA